MTDTSMIEQVEERAAEDIEHEGHASDTLYIQIAIGLAVLTGMEIAWPYLVDDGLILVLPLLFVMAIKFGIIAAFFMHLKFDNKILTRIFYTGLFLAVGVYVIALTTFHVWGLSPARAGSTVLSSVPEATGVWRYQIHPEVWVLVVGLTVLYVWAARVVGPKVVPEGEPVLTRRNIAAAVTGIVLLWAASDWPMHDIGEQYLYAVHMVQHTLLTLVVPPLALLATPRWLADLILGHGRVRRVIRTMALPVVAGVAYNAMAIAIHWPTLVNLSTGNGVVHYLVHVVLVFTALMMWMPVCGPIAEWRMGTPGKMIYLFLMSVVPTVPGGRLTFAEGAVYDSYDTPTRAFGISVQEDQQAAGVFMKLFAGSWLWFLITCMFFAWAFRHQREQEALDRAEREGHLHRAAGGERADDDEPLTYEAVARAFAATDPAPEPGARRQG